MWSPLLIHVTLEKPISLHVLVHGNQAAATSLSVCVCGELRDCKISFYYILCFGWLENTVMINKLESEN